MFRINPFIPVEVIAKVTRNSEAVESILTENTFLKLDYNEDYTCRVYEEVIAYSKEEDQIISLVSIVECAENDLL